MDAFRRKAVIKKASYYLWYLGAIEAKGLRGDEFIVPALQHLVEKERDLGEPSKVTLQVSNKGLKIIQNVPKKSKSGQVLNADQDESRTSCGPLGPLSHLPGVGGAKMEQIKTQIPHHAITYASQEEDIVCCILLLYNPITRCPVHVHAYRCDSVETATALTSQLQALIDRPENQKKFKEIEARLTVNGLADTSGRLLGHSSSGGSGHRSNSDGRSIRTDSDESYESYGRSFGGQRRDSYENNQINQDDNSAAPKSLLYDNVAHELKEKLFKSKAQGLAAIGLLPPPDYTLHRSHGDLIKMELYKSQNRGDVIESLPAKSQKASRILSDKKLAHRFGKGLKLSAGQAPTGKVTKGGETYRSESSGKSSGIGSDEALPVVDIKPYADRCLESEKLDTSDGPVTSGDTDTEDSSTDGWLRTRSERLAHLGQPAVPPPIGPGQGHHARRSNTNVHHQPSVHSKPKQPTQFYFPDPSANVGPKFSSKPAGPGQIIKPSLDERLKRQQSNPDFGAKDFFRRSRPIVTEVFRSSPEPGHRDYIRSKMALITPQPYHQPNFSQRANVSGNDLMMSNYNNRRSLCKLNY